MDIISTPRELIDRGVWGDACRMLGINEWAINEGQMDSGEEVRLTEDQAAELGLTIRRTEPETWTTPWGCEHRKGQDTCERCTLPPDSPAAKRLAAQKSDGESW